MLIRESEYLVEIGIFETEPGDRIAGQSNHDFLVTPTRVGGQQPHRGSNLFFFPNTFERLQSDRHQELESLELLQVVQHGRPEDPFQFIRTKERGEDQEHESAFVAFTTPGRRSQARIDVENPVAAGEGRVVLRKAREGPGNREFRCHPEDRKHPHVWCQLGDRRLQESLGPGTFAELVIDRSALPIPVSARS